MPLFKGTCTHFIKTSGVHKLPTPQQPAACHGYTSTPPPLLGSAWTPPSNGNSNTMLPNTRPFVYVRFDTCFVHDACRRPPVKRSASLSPHKPCRHLEIVFLVSASIPGLHSSLQTEAYLRQVIVMIQTVQREINF